jgi:hypothetical protein
MTHAAQCCMRTVSVDRREGASFDQDLGGWLLPCPAPASFVAHDGQA